MTEQPEALRLAEWIESDMSCHGDAEIAAKLRRLARVEEQRDELLEALKHAASWFDAAGIDVPASRHVIAAIDKAQQEK